MFKIVAGLISLFVVSAAGHAASLNDVLPIGGIYELNVIYKTEAAARPWEPLDRLVVLFSPVPGQIQLALAQSHISIPFIRFQDAKYEVAPNGHVLIKGLGGAPIRGEIFLDFDPVAKTFTGYFTDSLAEGYKDMSGKAISTLGDFLATAGSRASSLNMTGVYEQVGGKAKLVVRYYSDGSVSVALNRPFAKLSIMDTFDDGIYIQERGVLSAYSSVRNSVNSVREISLVAKENPGGPLRLNAQLISTAGTLQVFEFEKVGEALVPEIWNPQASIDDVKAKAPTIKAQMLRDTAAGSFVPYDGKLAAQTLTSILDKPVALGKGVSTFFIGHRAAFIPRKSFFKFLDHHVQLVTEKMSGRGLIGYMVYATEDYEVAILNWESQEAMDKAFAAMGPEIVADADKFMTTVIWEAL